MIRSFSLALLGSLLCATACLATVRSFDDIIAFSPNGEWKVSAISPDNRRRDDVIFGGQSNFVYSAFNEQGAKLVWTRKQAAQEPEEYSPVRVVVADDGWVAIQTKRDRLVFPANLRVCFWGPRGWIFSPQAPGPLRGERLSAREGGHDAGGGSESDRFPRLRGRGRLGVRHRWRHTGNAGSRMEGRTRIADAQSRSEMEQWADARQAYDHVLKRPRIFPSGVLGTAGSEGDCRHRQVPGLDNTRLRAKRL